MVKTDIISNEKKQQLSNTMFSYRIFSSRVSSSKLCEFIENQDFFFLNAGKVFGSEFFFN